VWQVLEVTVDVGVTGEVVAQLDIGSGLRTGRGLAGAGLVAMLADCVLGTDAALRARSGIATVVLTVDLVGHPPETGLLRAVSGPSGHRAGYLHTTADVRDGAGAEVARVSGWFAVRGGPAVPATTPPPQPHRPVSAPSGGEPAATGDDPTATPLGRTLGLTSFTRYPDHAVGFELAEVGRLRNSGGALHGGVAALMASVAALATLDGGAGTPEVLSMTCHYLRGAGGDGGPVRVDGRQIRRGRTSAVVEGDVYAPDGRPAMHLVVTTALTH
jgi:acyl-coenzyme A thioesterase PaaI-like protein